MVALHGLAQAQPMEPKSFSEAVKETKVDQKMDNDLDLVKSMPNKQIDTSKEKEQKIHLKDLKKVTTDLEPELPIEEIKEENKKEWMHAKQKNIINKDNALYKEE